MGESRTMPDTHTLADTYTHISPVRRRNATRKKKSGGKIAGDTDESGCVYPARCGGLKNGPRVYGHPDETREGSKKKGKSEAHAGVARHVEAQAVGITCARWHDTDTTWNGSWM